MYANYKGSMLKSMVFKPWRQLRTSGSNISWRILSSIGTTINTNQSKTHRQARVANRQIKCRLYHWSKYWIKPSRSFKVIVILSKVISIWVISGGSEYLITIGLCCGHLQSQINSGWASNYTKLSLQKALSKVKWMIKCSRIYDFSKMSVVRGVVSWN